MKNCLPLLTLLTCATLAFANKNPKAAPDLPDSSNNTVDVIVQFNHPPTSSDLQQLGQYQGQVQGNWGQAIKAVHLKVPANTVNQLSGLSSVSYVSPVRTVHRALDVVTATVNANIAWQYGFDGSGVGVAVIDSGITLRDDLTIARGINSRIVYSENFVDSAPDASDQYGHGTHVAGIIGSDGEDSTGRGFFRTFKGVAPNVNLINLKVLDANGAGQETDVIAAIQRAIQLKSRYNIRVINLSLGRPVFESYTLDPLCQAVEAAWKAGIVVVAAAGNSGRDNSMGTHGYGTIASPANDPYVITVGATNTNGTPYRWDDSIASYSSKGPTLVDHIVKPDLVAPGNNVVSLLAPNTTIASQYPTTLIPDNYYEFTGYFTTTSFGFGGNQPLSNTYYRLSGTSMATPVVAGTAALLIQQNPSITPDQVKARLMKTAGKILPRYSSGVDSLTYQVFPAESDIFTVGAGYLDIAAALNNTDLAQLPALSPTAVFNPRTGKVTILTDFSISWGDSVAWGDALVWGTSAFNGMINGAYIIWGDSVAATNVLDPGFSIIWGDSVNPNLSLQTLAANDSDQ